MTIRLKDLEAIRKSEEVKKLISDLLKKGYKFRPVGDMSNNAGPIELATEPVSPLIERTTNMFDGVLELLAAIKGSGQTFPTSPREAVARWADIKGGHVYNLDNKERKQIAEQVSITIDDSGNGKDKLPTFIFRDKGIGIHPGVWSETILSLNKGNKIDKLYLGGAYGQGGSSTFAYCPYTVIISRRDPRCLGDKKDLTGWTIVRINDEDDSLKNAVYEYLVDSNGNIPLLEFAEDEFLPGTYVAHLAYNAGPVVSKRMTLNSYRVFNNLLFDPVLPYWLKDARYNDNRSMGGHISRLPNSEMVEYKDEFTKIIDKESKLVIRYWVFKVKTEDGKKTYLSGFLEKDKSPDTILITLNGQKQGTLDKAFLKQLGLSFLSNFLLVQVECDGLGRKMKRNLFSSTREKTKSGEALEIIKASLAEVFNEDEDLQRLEAERKAMRTTMLDDDAQKKVRKLLDKYISKHLSSAQSEIATDTQVNGIAQTKLGQVKGDKVALQPSAPTGRGPNSKKSPPIIPIAPNDPPNFINIESADPLKIYSGGSAWIRIACNAPDDFLTRPINAGNLITTFVGLDNATVDGRTGLKGGRMKVKISVSANIEEGTLGNVTIKLEGSGFKPLIATCAVLVIPKPEIPQVQTEATKESITPLYDIRPVTQDDEMWYTLGWDKSIVGEYQHSQGELIFYINLSNDLLVKEVERKKTPELVSAFESKYMAMIAYNLWLHFKLNESNQGIDEEQRHEELKRTAETLILTMRSEADLEQD